MAAIQVADSIDPAHAERALAHELTEIVAQRALYHEGKVAAPSVLKCGPLPPGAELSPHDRGRVAEPQAPSIAGRPPSKPPPSRRSTTCGRTPATAR